MDSTEQTREISDLDKMDGHEFEDLIAKLMDRMGFVTHERKLSCDGGIDILAENFEPILQGSYIIQCKRQTKKVEEHIIRDLFGVVHSKNANKGILITNSKFTDSALKFAQNKQLELIDGEKLHSLLVKYNIGNLKQGIVILPNSSRFLMNNFAPSLIRICKDIDDAKNGLLYIEKNSHTMQKWLSICQIKLQRVDAYCQFTTKTVNQCFERISIDNDNFERIKEYSNKILEATEKIANDYKEVLGIIPPRYFENVHTAFLNFYNPIFGNLRKFATDIQEATANAQPRIYDIAMVFDAAEEAKIFNEEFLKATEKFSANVGTK